MPHHPHIGRLIAVLAAVAAAFAGSVLAGPGAAAATAVQVTMTTTSDGRTVVRGLQEQAPAAFEAGNGSGGTVITVDPAARYQPFEGGGASFTDSAAWLMNSSGALSAATRDATMRKLFSPTEGIGLGFLRNPMGASDIARSHYTYDDTCCDLSDFSISRDLADVLPMTQRARQLNPDLKVVAVPWSAAGVDEGQRQADPDGQAEARVLRHVRAVLREVPAGLRAARRPRRLRLGAERAAVLRREQQLPHHGVVGGHAAGLHQEPPLPGVPFGRDHHQGARPRLEPRRLEHHRQPASSPTPRCAATPCSEASPGTATPLPRRTTRWAAPSRASTRVSRSTRPSTPAAHGSAISSWRTCGTSPASPATGPART